MIAFSTSSPVVLTHPKIRQPLFLWNVANDDCSRLEGFILLKGQLPVCVISLSTGLEPGLDAKPRALTGLASTYPAVGAVREIAVMMNDHDHQ